MHQTLSFLPHHFQISIFSPCVLGVLCCIIQFKVHALPESLAHRRRSQGAVGVTLSCNRPLPLFQAILGPLQGLLNCIIYGWKRDSFRRALTESSHLLSTNRGSVMTFTL